MRAALYIRVSDEDQVKEGFSIDAQRTLLIKKAEQFEYTIHDVYVDDGYSAKNMKRPGLIQILKDVEDGKVQVVLFWRLDRFTRKSKDFQKIMETLIKYNAGIKSATENIDTTTAMGRFQLELTVSLAQLERETTSERVHFVMEDRHMKGMRNGAVAPIGYDLVDGELFINPIEAEIVKRIFQLYQENKSCRYIAKLFNAEGVPKRNSVSKWAEYTVWYILDNPVYCGKLRWNNRKQAGAKTGSAIIVPGKHKPIISEDEYNRVIALRDHRKKEGKKATSDFIFSSIIKCGRCGYGLIGGTRPVKDGTSKYYRCLGRFNYGVCDMPIVKEASMNEAFLEAIHPDYEEIEKLIVVNESAASSENSGIRQQLESELNQIHKRKKKWQVAYANDALTLEELKEHTADDKQREDYLNLQLEQVPKIKKSHWNRDEILQQLKQTHALWYQIEDAAAKKNFLSNVFEYITINTDVTAPKGGPGKYTKVYITGWGFKS